MFRYVGLWLGLLSRSMQSHRSLLLENLALRQQLAVLKRKHPRPPDWSSWQILLGIRPSFLGCLEAVSCARESWDCRPLASCRFSLVLEFDLQGQTASGKEEAV